MMLELSRDLIVKISSSLQNNDQTDPTYEVAQ